MELTNEQYIQNNLVRAERIAQQSLSAIGMNEQKTKHQAGKLWNTLTINSGRSEWWATSEQEIKRRVYGLIQKCGHKRKRSYRLTWRWAVTPQGDRLFYAYPVRFRLRCCLPFYIVLYITTRTKLWQGHAQVIARPILNKQNNNRRIIMKTVFKLFTWLVAAIALLAMLTSCVPTTHKKN